MAILHLQVPKAIGDYLVGDMPFKVDQEAVVAKALSSRTRLQPCEVDRPGSKFLKDAEQASWPIRILEYHYGCLVVPGWRRNTIGGNNYEPCLVLRVVFNVGS